MQPTPGGGGDGGRAGPNRLGLARFRSAPTTWLEALLEENEEESDPLNQNQTLTQLLVSNTRTSVPFRSSGSGSIAEPGGFAGGSANLFEPGLAGFQRQNSSPADFLVNSAVGSAGYFRNYQIPSSYEYSAPDIAAAASSSSSGKRVRDDLHLQRSMLKGEPSMPTSSSGGRMSSLVEMEVDKLLGDSVPCRVRAKRGCATHPRSIAERVRRTRISDRIRKLQELVPNMDKAQVFRHPTLARTLMKQTNTADMLDEAVEYVKFLQRQIQELTEQQMKCTCMSKE